MDEHRFSFTQYPEKFNKCFAPEASKPRHGCSIEWLVENLTSRYALNTFAKYIG